MGILGLLSKSSKQHPILGDITYSFGKWKGNSANLFGYDSVEIRIPGDKNGPSEQSLSQLFELKKQYPLIKNELAQTLFDDHYIHGKDAFDSGEFEDLMEDYPDIKEPSGIWEYVAMVRVWVDSYGNKGQIELAFGTEWDIEHTLGFVIEGGKVIEFCSSVGP